VSSMHVVRDGFVLALSADHPLSAADTVALDDLDGVDFVGYSTDRGGFLRDVHSLLFSTAGITPNLRQEVSQTHTVLALVNRGIGIGLVPQSSRAMQMENLVYRDIDLPSGFASDLYLAHGPRGRSPLHAKVRDTIRNALSGFMPDTRKVTDG